MKTIRISVHIFVDLSGLLCLFCQTHIYTQMQFDAVPLWADEHTRLRTCVHKISLGSIIGLHGP